MITFKNEKQLSLNNNIKIKSKGDIRILNDPEGFFKDMSDKEFVEWLNEVGINYKLKDGVKIV